MSEMHFATIWENISDQQPDAPAVICKDISRSWKEYEDRAARVAGYLSSKGLKSDSKVGLYLHNCNEYLEAQFGIMKMRGVPINANYRYQDEELIYLLDNADCEALVYQACYADRVESIRGQLPRIKTFIRVKDESEGSLAGDIEFDDLIAKTEPMPRIERSPDDIYMLYTGGTTGMPKGVMYSMGQMSTALTMGWVMLGGVEVPPGTPETIATASAELTRSGNQLVSLTACPLMHGTGMWVGSMIPHMMGGAVVTIPELGLDPIRIWKEVNRNKVSFVVIVGDAFAKPLLSELDKAKDEGSPHDISSVKVIMSSGVMWSAEVKQGLLNHQEMSLIDAMGSTEGSMGTSVATRESVSQTAKFQMSENVKVFNENDEEVKPGSGEIGVLGAGGNVPLGYYKDPEKSATTFREIDGVRYSFPGDFATVEADGSITLLGRGSKCINTAGEKVFPEEVEEAIKRAPEIFDCLVVGVPDDRFGQKIVAVTSLNEGMEIDEASLIEATRKHLSGYKLPRKVFFVPLVQRLPNGKADYGWAEETASELSA
ncbi:MAG: acyl-CoA synthetase [Gammaproteobacteria bacterium]|nr:acyl-CoA synthetase [Gammaproteobacteria bacterium]